MMISSQMTEGPQKPTRGKKGTSSNSNLRNKTALLTNSSVSTTNASFISGKGKKKSLVPEKTSLPVVSSSGLKKGKSGTGKFAFQGAKAFRQSSPSSDEPTQQDRLFSLQDLKEIASIVRETKDHPSARATSSEEKTSAARTTKISRPSKTIKKPGTVQFANKKGKHISFQAKRTAVKPYVPQIVDEIGEDMPNLGDMGARQNPYSYAFSS